MSLTKIAFVLLAVAFLMPTPPETEPAAESSAKALPSAEFVAAASDTLSDVSGFCGRQPGVCETAGYVLHKLEAKAKYGVRLLYEWANESEAGVTPMPQSYRNEAVADPLATGSTSLASDEESPGTLTIEDLIPEWRGPGAVKRG